MATATLSPGLYRKIAPPPVVPSLATGVAGFVGFGDTGTPGWARLTGAADLSVAGSGNAGSSLAQAIRGFFSNGGSVCYVAAASPVATDRAGALIDALAVLAAIPEVDVIACPDATRLVSSSGAVDRDGMVRVQRAMLVHAALHRCFALLDAAPGSSTAMVLAQRSAVVAGVAEPVNGALYYPWLKDEDDVPVPPCGHIAGIVAGTDAAAGVARAPAGGEVRGVLDVELVIDAANQADLNVAGVNCLRPFPGRGVRVWGARTLSADPDWTYINVRRLILTLARWIDANLGWAVFEPNLPATWARVERVLTAHLTQLWRRNALRGTRADQAFFVRCDATTNSAAQRDAGGMIVDLGLAVAAPAEFITVRLDLLPQAA